MRIEVNGNGIDYVKGETIAELLERMRYKFPMVIVKLNGKVIATEKYPTTKFRNGAKIEVIHLISGG